ncbi:transmembrane protease serine 12 [Aplysia californica]|uniref:Transmembrane protease serine 12 n=1 Tax=Aplysia californica TaxID=6500 RepID=A0ABM0ZWI8_APLCA|nr:transmembrane protease serine 12 [Aplysia californica]
MGPSGVLGGRLHVAVWVLALTATTSPTTDGFALLNGDTPDFGPMFNFSDFNKLEHQDSDIFAAEASEDDGSEFGPTFNISEWKQVLSQESNSFDAKENVMDDKSDATSEFGPTLVYRELFAVDDIPHTGDGPLVYRGPEARDENLTRGDDGIAPSPSIIGGINVPISLVPYTVALLVRSGGLYYQICGGVLMTRRKVLTAAHCVDQSRTYYVMMGVSDLRDSRNPYLQLIQVSRKYIHSSYRTYQDYDIAMLTLSSSARLNSRTWIVFPGYYLDTLPIKRCTVSGWGRTRTGEFFVGCCYTLLG